MTIRRYGLGLAGALLLATISSLPASAAELNLGVRGGAYLDDGDAFLGADLLMPFASSDVAFNPNVEVVFPGEGSLLTANFDFLWNFHREGPVDFWAGAGPAYVRFDPPGRSDKIDTVAANLIFGASWNVQRSFLPYAQVKVIVPADADVDTQGVLAVGLRF